MSQQVRETQRIPRSCISCSRRKVKCSKRIPCEQCIQRGDVAGCRREIVKVGGKVTIAVDAAKERLDDTPSDSQLLRENESLKTRIKQLELALTRPELAKLESNTSASSKPITRGSQSPEAAMNDFQTQAFGLSVDHTHRHPNNNRASDHNVKLILPTRRWSEKIIGFSLAQLGWVHCAVDETVFWNEHDAFWDNLLERENECLTEHNWMTVYLSLLATGAYFMNEEELCDIHLLYESFFNEPMSKLSLPSKNSCGLARAWYEAALRELDLAESTRKPALSTVQAIAILNILHKNLGESAREYILHGMAVNVARLIGLDHLGDEKSRLTMNNDQRLVCQNLWWTLVICDWLTIWSRPISIHPDSFTTVLETSSPPQIEYHKAMARIATMARNQITSIREWSPDGLQDCFEDIDTIAVSFPSSTLNSPNEDNTGSWTSLQCQLASNCVDSWQLSLNVPMLLYIVDDTSPTAHEAMDRGIITAKQIIHRAYTNTDPLYPKFWSVVSAVVSAGIFLALDLICFQRQRPSAKTAEQKDAVAISYRLTDQSTAETRHGGLLVLSRLSHLYDTVLPAYPNRIDCGALARILRLVALPRLWNSLTDADATVRFIFQDKCPDVRDSPDSVSSSPIPPHSVSTLRNTQPTLPSALAPQEEFDPWGVSGMMGQDETTQFFGQCFPSTDLIDASLLFADSALMGEFREGS